MRRPMAVQTPNTFHSTNDFSFSIGAIGLFIKNTTKSLSLRSIFLILPREIKINDHGI